MEINIHESQYAQKAETLFKSGCNCSQAVLLSFADICGIDRKTALMISSSFGGGTGRLREVCGAFSGLCMAAGLLYGYDDVKDYNAKSEHYKRIQLLAEEFRKMNGSIICRELLGLNVKHDIHTPEKRTQEYYKKRPCSQICPVSAAILEAYISEHPIENGGIV